MNRVAKGAGYDHWHHVTQCAELSKGSKGLATLRTECDAVSRAEIQGDVRVVLTGPELMVGPFVIFSTGIGDAWLLDPNEGLAMCLVWQSKRIEPDIRDDESRIHIGWDGDFELLGDFFKVDTGQAEIGTRAIGGYPMEGVREMVDRALSFERKFDAVIAQSDAIEITDDVIAHMKKKGYSEKELLEMKADGFRYSPSRDSLIGSVFSSDDDLDD